MPDLKRFASAIGHRTGVPSDSRGLDVVRHRLRRGASHLCSRQNV